MLGNSAGIEMNSPLSMPAKQARRKPLCYWVKPVLV